MDAYAQRWNMLWSVQRSIRYHARREVFFDRWHKLTAGASLLFASAAVADLLRGAGHWGAVAAALIVAVLSAADLIVGTMQMSHRHLTLRQRFIDLERRVRAQPDADAAMVQQWVDERLRIERDEPPIYIALDLMCENEQAQATAEPRYFRLNWWQRITANWLHWPNLQPAATAAR